VLDLNFTLKTPYSLTIAADSRLSQTDYVNDQIWELNIGNSEPPSVSLQTTFGLRAKICRIFPRFILGGQVINNPTEFQSPVTLHHYLPNYICLTFKPFSTINVQIEYWVPGSQLAAGRTKITNIGQEKCQFQLEWAEILIPSTQGDRMSVNEIGLTPVLVGNTSDLFPVFYLTGGVQAGKSPYPSLNLAYEIQAHREVISTWAHAALNETQKSFDLAKALLNQNWDAEFAKIERVNLQDLEIRTGDREWDRAFYFSQVFVKQLLLSPTDRLGSPSFIQSRKPDQGFSLVGDGSDYDHLWNGQTIQDAYFLSELLLPSSPDRFIGILNNFIATQDSDGEIDWKPGLGGQQARLLCTPLLSRLCLLTFGHTGDLNYLANVYPKLLRYFLSWFSARHDRDNDGIPEWDQIIQTGFDENPYFSNIYPWSLGLDISSVESPDLASYLYDECQALTTIATRLGDTDTITQLETIATRLKGMVLQTWSDEQIMYQYRDRDSHTTSPLVFLGHIQGEGILDIHQEFLQPVRPFFHIRTSKEGTIPIQLFVHGTTSGGSHRVERIATQMIHWHQSSAYATCESTFMNLEQVQVRGISKEIEVEVKVGLSKYLDQTLLLPLWAGIPSDEQAKVLINLVIMNKKKLLNPYGLKSAIKLQENEETPEEFLWVHPLFHNFIISGLIRYGEHKKAAEIFIRFMNAVLKTLNTDLKFYQHYHSETGKPVGPTNTMKSLVPIGLFLKILGVKIINTSKIEITGENPFPWPVTIKYRGLTIIQQAKSALIIFPDGQNVTIDNNKSQIISLQ
jgi:hypothetical protein